MKTNCWTTAGQAKDNFSFDYDLICIKMHGSTRLIFSDTYFTTIIFPFYSAYV